MSDYELEADFWRMKTETLDQIERIKEQWQRTWEGARESPAAENSLIHLKLEIQLMEARALEKLGQMEDKIRKTVKDGEAA